MTSTNARLHTGVACVGYADFLDLTLPHSIRSLGDVTVITSNSDRETLRIAEKYSARVHSTDAWFENGSSFNKAAALNSWLDSIDPLLGDWIVTLDADIIVPPDVLGPLEELDPRGLYSVRRRICAEQEDWNAFVAGRRTWHSFGSDPEAIRHGKLWGVHDTTNVAGIYGYFQLWHASASVGNGRFRSFPTAAEYDVMFALSFGDEHRHYLVGREVLHLGPTKTNWAGRRSEAWANPARLQPEADCLRNYMTSRPELEVE